MVTGTLGGTVALTIANGQTTSNALDLREKVLVGLQFATMTGTALTFTASSDGVTYVALKDSAGAAVSFTIASDTYTVIQPAILAGVRYLKLVSGSSEGAARTITAIVRQCA
jgi:hypothetical protein